jgi:hypothetical protein
MLAIVIAYKNYFVYMIMIEIPTQSIIKVSPGENEDGSISVSGTYFLDSDHTIKNISSTDRVLNHPLPYSGILEHLDYRKVCVGDGSESMRTAFIGNIHPDESETVEIVKDVLATRTFPRIEVMASHPLADVLNRRDYVVPYTEARGILPSDIIWMNNGKETEENDVLAKKGVKIDLNRQFIIEPHAKTFDDVLAAIPYAPARLLTYILRDNPTVHTIFSFHEDMEFGNFDPHTSILDSREIRAGYYFYYNIMDSSRKSSERKIIQTLHAQTVQQLADAGFGVFNGIDDPNDSYLGLRSVNGCIAQNVKHKNEKTKFTGSFEEFAVELGRRGIGTSASSFVFEIPGKMRYEEKYRMVQILFRSFITPYIDFQNR